MAVQYTKPSLSCADQLNLLKSRGLTVDDDAKALHLLEHIGYYRLSGYWYPLLDFPKSDHRFKANATFDAAFKMYRFDRELRMLVLGEIEKIEIAVKSKMVHIFSDWVGPHWYTDKKLFKNLDGKHTSTLVKLLDAYENSREDFVTAFKRNYTDKYPPAWIMMEIASFGSVSWLYSDLNGGRSRRNVALHFGLDDSTLCSWLHCFGYLRNICAHHARFWNRVFAISPQIPQRTSKVWLSRVYDNNRSYFVLSMVLYLLQTINPKNTFRLKFRHLLKTYPSIDIMSMGFPKLWENEALWRE